MNDIEVSKMGTLLVIEMNRPDKKNALTQAMYQSMSDAIVAAQQDSQVRVILIKGKGDCFTAGNDMQDFASSGTTEQTELLNPFMLTLVECKLPVVAQVEGLAIGIGTTMLLHCDLVVCADNARFSLPFVDLALVPEFASSLLLPKLTGHRKASKYLMLGERFGPQEAVECGLISDVVPANKLSDRTNEIINQLADKPRTALMQTKQLMKSDQQEILLHMHKELDIFVHQLTTPAAKEAFNAFLEKRAPDKSIYN